MGSRNMLKLGVPVGNLEVQVDGNLEIELSILYKQNGKKSFSISKNSNSTLYNETDIGKFRYEKISDLENYVRKKVKGIYHTPWYKFATRQPKIEVTYQSYKNGVKIAEERRNANRLKSSGEHA
ncbi:MAG: hypothetical protein V3R78_01340 [Thermodesulfobacteriota bacterium]